MPGSGYGLGWQRLSHAVEPLKLRLHDLILPKPPQNNSISVSNMSDSSSGHSSDERYSVAADDETLQLQRSVSALTK